MREVGKVKKLCLNSLKSGEEDAALVSSIEYCAKWHLMFPPNLVSQGEYKPRPMLMIPFRKINLSYPTDHKPMPKDLPLLTIRSV